MSMSTIERVLPFVDRLPDSVREMAVRRFREMAGLGLIAIACAAAAAFITWSVQDPSLSHATSKPIRNILGYPGAIGADPLMQIFGLSFGATMAMTFVVAIGVGSRAKADEIDQIDDSVAEGDETQDDNSRGTIVSLGMIAHAALSAKARLGRLAATIYRWLVGAQSPARVVHFDRREPSLGEGAAPSLAPG